MERISFVHRKHISFSGKVLDNIKAVQKSFPEIDFFTIIIFGHQHHKNYEGKKIDESRKT